MSGPGDLRVEDVADPRPDGRAVVAVRRAGLCGTDTKILSGGIPVACPRVLGHELVGDVVQPAASGGLAAGTRVLVDPAVACGTCRVCRDDNVHLCPNGGLMGRDVDGGFAEYVAVDEQQLVTVPEHVEGGSAALLQVLGTCVHAQRLVPAFPGQTAAVVGLGVSGLLHLQLLRLRGIERVLGISRSPGKLNLARQLGAAQVATPDEASAALEELTDGRGADLVVESVGKIATLSQAIELAALAGTVMVYGTVSPSSSGDLPFYQLYHKELRLVSPRAARHRDYQRSVVLVADGRLQLAPLVSATYPLEDAAAAFGAVDDGDVLKVTLEVGSGR